jgi:DNA-binding XRE family transcriptional regulator
VPRRPPEDDDWTLRQQRFLAARVRDKRRELRLTQEELHLAAGISRWSLQDIESGEGNPKLITLMRIAWVLDMHVSDLLR